MKLQRQTTMSPSTMSYSMMIVGTPIYLMRWTMPWRTGGKQRGLSSTWKGAENANTKRTFDRQSS